MVSKKVITEEIILDDSDVTKKLNKAKTKGDKVAKQEIEIRKKLDMAKEKAKSLDAAKRKADEIARQETEISRKLDEAKKKAEEIAKEEAKIRMKVAQTATTLSTIALGFAFMFRNIMTLMGHTLDATGAAMMLVVEQIIYVATSWFTLQAAIASAPVAGQLVAGFSFAMASVALAVAIAQGVAVAQGQEELNSKVNTALSAMSNLDSIARGLGGL